MSKPLVLAIDQGTTGTTVLVLDEALEILGKGYAELPQSYPAPGLVEHDPEAIWTSVLAAMAKALAPVAGQPITCIGVTNQRETVVVWERATGRAVAPAIVWQDRRTAERCQALRQAGHEPAIQRTTGLLLDPYFSATKLAWMLENIPGLRPRCEAGEILFGTVDSYLVWRLSGGHSHITDVTNASRTLLLDLGTLDWSSDLCRLFAIPSAILPRVCPSSGKRCRVTPVGAAGRVTGTAGVAAADWVDAGRPASRAFRPRLSDGRPGQVHLRHRILSAHQRRRACRAIAAPTARHRGLAASIGNKLRARRQRLRVGRARAMAARRPRHHQESGRHRGATRGVERT